jgi:hypothetical protein
LIEEHKVEKLGHIPTRFKIPMHVGEDARRWDGSFFHSSGNETLRLYIQVQINRAENVHKIGNRCLGWIAFYYPSRKAGAFGRGRRVDLLNMVAHPLESLTVKTTFTLIELAGVTKNDIHGPMPRCFLGSLIL